MSFGGVLILVGLTLWITACSVEARIFVGFGMLLLGMLIKIMS